MLRDLERTAWSRGWRRSSQVLRWFQSAGTRRCEDAYRAYVDGDLERATQLLQGLHDWALARPDLWNQVVCVYVASGRYREALAGLEAPWRARYQTLGHPWPDRMVVLRINEAEAFHSLGESRRAITHVARPGRSRWVESARAGHLVWVHATLGELDAARAALRGVTGDHENLEYRSEGYFAQAFLHLAAGEVAEAEAAIRSGAAEARRASSRRNAEFLSASAARVAGDAERALERFAAAAAHPYRGQGGGSLLEWGDLCAAAGRSEIARRAWSLAVERDPESAAAGLARARLDSVERDEN